jgi:hypothetical protein
MTEAPDINVPEVAEPEYGPKMINVDGLVEIFKQSGGRSEAFESAFSFWRSRMERLADKVNGGPERTLARLEIIMFEAEIFLRIGDISSAVKAMEDIWLIVGNDPAFEYDEASNEIVDLYGDIDFLQQMLEAATRK